ncbi:MAG: hypothetical protein WEB85_09630 [Dongiaceae bacterium]
MAPAAGIDYSAAMSDPPEPGAGDAEAPDLDALARRYLDLWQDQVAAVAGDADLIQEMTRLIALIGAAAGAAAWNGRPPAPGPGAVSEAGGGGDGSASDGAGRAAAGGGAAGAAAASASPRRGGDDLARLDRRLAALERRIARLEAGATGAAGRTAGKPRKRRS